MELVEIIWDLLSDLINDFLFEVNSGLFNMLMHGMSVRTKKYGRHRSIVRWIGTALPLTPCRRTYSSIFLSENKHGAYPTYGFAVPNNPHEGCCDFETWSRDLKSNAPDVVSSIKFSTPKERIVGKDVHREVSAEQFAALEEQVLLLQAEISKILSAQLLNPLQDPKAEDRQKGLQIELDIEKSPRRHSTSAVVTTAGSSEPPPPPPPPPPPMPMFSFSPKPLMRSQSLTDQIHQHSKKQNNEQGKRYCSTLPRNMSDVLKDLGTVKLRHVERSPGGTPLRRRPLTPPRNDPAALLAAALRRRFANMRHDDSSPDHTPVIDSSPNKSFESMEQVSFTLSPQAINNLGTLKI